MNAMLRILGIVLSGGMCALALGCSSVSYNSDYDPDFDFTTPQTYAWPEDVTPSKVGERGLNELDEKRVIAAVERELNGKGLEKNTSAPTLLVNFYLTTEEKVDITTYHDGWGYHGGYAPYGAGGRTDVRQWTQGMLFVDLIDASGKDLAWRGWATGSVDGLAKMTPEERTKAFDEVIAEILTQYPPAAE